MRSNTTNNFDFIRLLAAAMVLCSHQFALLGLPEPQPFGLLRLGTLGVLVFFSVSGYLVAQSWERDPHIGRFIARRFLRVWPGLAAVILLTVFCVGPIYSTWSPTDYFGSAVSWHYLRQLYLQVELYLPGVFEAHPIHVVNGSLWTIPIEVGWYGGLVVAGLCGLLRHRARYVLLVVVLAYAIYIYGIFDVQGNPRAGYLQPAFGREYGSFFCYGVLLQRWQHVWRKRPVRTALALSILAGGLITLGYGYAALYVLLPVMVIGGGEMSTPFLRQAGRYGDFSYGIYIYAFMAQQAVIAGLGIHRSYLVILAISVVATVACAWLSWQLVERPALSLKRHLSAPSAAGRLASERDGALTITP